MKYAVISFGPKQYKVSEGDQILVELLDTDKKTGTTSDVLLVADGDKVKIGTPLLKGAKVKYSLIDEEVKMDKIKTLRYRAKSRYRKTFGHRQKMTKIKIDNITLS